MRRDSTSSVACQGIRQPYTTRSKVVRLGRELSNGSIRSGEELIIYQACPEDLLATSQSYENNEFVLYEPTVVRSNGLTKKYKHQQYRKTLTNCYQEIIQTGYLIIGSESGTALILNQLMMTRYPYLKLLVRLLQRLKWSLSQKLVNTNLSQPHPMKENYRRQYNKNSSLLLSVQGNSRGSVYKQYTIRYKR